MNMIKITAAAAAVFAAAICGTAAAAQDWPARPITIVVPFAAGGPTDFIARILAEPLSDELGQPLVIAHRPGAGGPSGVQGVKEAPADGCPLVHTPIAAHALNPVLYTTWKVSPAPAF